MKLTEQQLSSINGGAIKAFGYLLIGGFVTFAIGFASGWKRPLTCSSGK